jgi:hypothetical protein
LLWTALLACSGADISTASLPADAPSRTDPPAAQGAIRGDGIGPGQPPAPQPLVTASESDTLLLLPRLTMPSTSLPVDAGPGVSPPALPRQHPQQDRVSPGPDATAVLSSIGAALEARTRGAAKEHPHAADEVRSGFSAVRIAHIRRALRLRPDQIAYWQPVEAILRDIAREQQSAARDLAASAATSMVASIDPDKLQQLTSAAIPLIMSMDEAQKREIRALAHAMGLDSVASAI